MKERQQLITNRVACLVPVQVSGPNIDYLTLTTKWFTAAFSPSQDIRFSSEVSSTSSGEFSTHIFANGRTSRY